LKNKRIERLRSFPFVSAILSLIGKIALIVAHVLAVGLL